MDYLNGLYEGDKEYNEFVAEFESKYNRLKTMAEQGVYSQEAMKQAGEQLKTQVKNFSQVYYQGEYDKWENERQRIEKQSKNIGVSDRPDETKEFEIRFSLANDHELKNMVQDLDTDDYLEASLLRQELRKRELNDQDDKVKRYVMYNRIDVPEGKREKLEDINNKLAVLNTRRDRSMTVDGQMKQISQIEQDIDYMVAKGGSGKRNINIDKLFSM